MPSFVWFIAILVNLPLIQALQGTVQERFKQSLVTLSVEKEQVCANKGDSLTVSCTLAVHGTKTVFKNWTLSWYTEGIHLTEKAREKRQNASHLTSYLKLDAVWSGEKLFTCVASRFSNDDERWVEALNSTSVVKVKSPSRCDIIGFRYIEKPARDEFDRLEVYWRPVKPSKNTVYTLNLCTEPERDPDDDVSTICPQYYSINGSCSYREKDVYNLQNTKGFTCMASTSMVTSSFSILLSEGQTNRAYISSREGGESCEHRCSNERKFTLSRFRLSKESGITEVVWIPTRIASLHVITRVPREVTLIWSASVKRRKYIVRYKCSNDSTWNNTAELIQKKLTLNRGSFQNYRPYDLCRFCVIVTALYVNGHASEPLCKDIRLHEEPPSSAPNITCPENKCQSTRDDHVRNVLITWALPPRKDWYGVLTEVRISYRDGLEKPLGNISDYPNSIKVPIRNTTTNGQTLLTGLSVSQTYWIEMVACNREGCSRPGKPLIVQPLPLTESDDKSKYSILNKPIILAACIAGVLLTAYLIYLTYTYVNARRQLRPKLELKLCEQSGYDVIMENPKKNEYDVLVVLDSTLIYKN